jgi:hypothetical protein
MVITISAKVICVFRCAWTSTFDSNYLIHVYLRCTGYYSHERICDIEWINHIDRFSVNCTRELLSTFRPSWGRSSSEYLIIQGLKDCLSDIESVYLILRHVSRIPDLPNAYSRAFPRSGMNFTHTSKALCCRVWWSQIWHHMHIPFNGQTCQATTHHYHRLPLPGATLNDSFCSIRTIFSSFRIALNLCLPAHTEGYLSETILLGADATHPAQPKLLPRFMLDRDVMATP